MILIQVETVEYPGLIQDCHLICSGSQTVYLLKDVDVNNFFLYIIFFLYIVGIYIILMCCIYWCSHLPDNIGLFMST